MLLYSFPVLTFICYCNMVAIQIKGTACSLYSANVFYSGLPLFRASELRSPRYSSH